MPNERGHRTTREHKLTLFLCGDVMTGRGIDQILPHPGPAALQESYVKNAIDYVTMAERRNGDIPRPVRPTYIWGDALKILDDISPNLRIANLETSITGSNDFWPGKGIHYRMSPGNIHCLEAAKFDCCTLANNHVLDFGYAGLGETVTTLNNASIETAGAGRSIDAASAPARINITDGTDVLVFGVADPSSGVPQAWRAEQQQAGVNLLADLTSNSASRFAEQILAVKGAGDIVVASIHWGGNWGYDVPNAQSEFAHYLIDQGAADVVHGHSAHHHKAVEIYRNRPIIYGCGDFITDYEGIGGHEEYRPSFSLMYFVTLNLNTGNIEALHIVPLRVYRMQLVHATTEDRRWILEKLNTLGAAYSTQFALAGDRLVLTEQVVP